MHRANIWRINHSIKVAEITNTVNEKMQISFQLITFSTRIVQLLSGMDCAS